MSFDRTLTESALDELYRTGKLTVGVLDRAVYNVDPVGYECIPFNTGMCWLANHQWSFLKVLRNEGMSVIDFFRAHLGYGTIADALDFQVVLRSLLPWKRMELIRDLFLMTDSCDYGMRWLQTALDVGIPRHQLGQLITDKLLCEPVNQHDKIGLFARDFLRTGGGSLYRNHGGLSRYWPKELSYWQVMSDRQFMEALGTIARRFPWLFFDNRDINNGSTAIDRLRLRLNQDQLHEVLELAARNLKSTNGVSTDTLTCMSSETLTAVIRNTDGGSADLLIQTALRLGLAHGGDELLMDYGHRLDFRTEDVRYPDIVRSMLVQTYGRWHQALENSTERTLSTWILAKLDCALRRHGFIVAIITEGIVTGGRRQGKRQLQVVHNGVTYVDSLEQLRMETWEKRYYPQKGDLVLLSTTHGRQLTPKVRTAYMRLLHRPDGDQ